MGVLVTGATGLLGAHLVRQLVNQGQKPRILVRERSDRRGLRGLKLEESQGDILDPASLAAAFKGVDEVYHLAGVVRFDPASTDLLHKLHVQGTRNILQAAKAAGVRRLVHVSTIAAVGHGPLNHPATESAEFNFAGPYPESKRQAEQVAVSESGEVEVVVANPTFIVGPYDIHLSSNKPLLLVARGLSPLYPTGGTNFVGADDVAQGLILLMQKGRPNERYILGGENLTYREFLTQCAEEAGAMPPLFPMPEPPMLWLGKLGDRLGRFAPNLFKDLNSTIVWSMFTPAYASSHKAETEVGYRAHPVRKAIRDAYRWFQDEGLFPRDRPLTPQSTQRSSRA
jgi:dihydroflavonol-4-reductase